MANIFRSLALIALLLLAGNIGWVFYDSGEDVRAADLIRSLKDIRGRSQVLHREQRTHHIDGLRSLEQQEADDVEQLKAILRRSSIHFLFIVATSLLCILISSVTITYFIGTSRWCREVAETYELEADLVGRSLQLKRHSFLWSFLAIGVVIVLAAFAGAANPGVRLEAAAEWGSLYQFTAVLSGILVAVSFHKQAGYLAANYDLIREIVAEVQEIRAARGLHATTD